jgi:hypothetical protein
LWHPISPSNEWSAYRSAALLWVWMHLSPKFAIFFSKITHVYLNYTIIMITRLNSSCLAYVFLSGKRCFIFGIVACLIFTRELGIFLSYE